MNTARPSIYMTGLPWIYRWLPIGRRCASSTPARAQITYAGKAFFCKAIAEWISQQGLWADCTGESEIGVAMGGGAPRTSIVVHGVNKSSRDLLSAQHHAGTIVVDNLTELKNLAKLKAAAMPNIWLRLLPGLAVATHHSHTQTGQHGSKFGMTTEEILEAVHLCKDAGLPLNGLDFHQGSNFRDPAPLVAAITSAGSRQRNGAGDRWHFCPGGGWSVAYHEDELPQPDIREVRLPGCADRGEHVQDGWPPIAGVAPGAGPQPDRGAGVGLYRVGVVKRRHDPQFSTWVLVDGGMADNPRHALYGAKYSCLPVAGLERVIQGTSIDCRTILRIRGCADRGPVDAAC